jgi:hypothetical protein
MRCSVCFTLCNHWNHAFLCWCSGNTAVPCNPPAVEDTEPDYDDGCLEAENAWLHAAEFNWEHQEEMRREEHTCW